MFSRYQRSKSLASGRASRSRAASAIKTYRYLWAWGQHLDQLRLVADLMGVRDAGFAPEVHVGRRVPREIHGAQIGEALRKRR